MQIENWFLKSYKVMCSKLKILIKVEVMSNIVSEQFTSK